MLSLVKDYIKTQPRAYDWLNAWRSPQSAMEQWLADFSRPGLRFIQIGASDGLRWDPYRQFIVRDQWQGLLIEPLPDVFQLLKQNYAHLAHQGLTFVNAAITDQDGSLTFWTWTPTFLASVDTEERLGLQRLASFTRDQIIKNLPDRLQYTVQHLVPVQVQALSMATLLRQYPCEPVDLVTVDAEGHDDAIVLSMPLDTFRPRAIIFEAHNLGQDRRAAVFSWLIARGYTVRLFKGDAVAERNW